MIDIIIPKNTKNKMEVSKIKPNQNIVHDVSAIQSLSKLSLVELKLFEIILSALDTKKPPKNNEILLSKNDIFKMLDLDPKSTYSRNEFQKHLVNLQSFVFAVYDKDTKKYDNYTFIGHSTWNENNDNDIVKITFMEETIKLLTTFKNTFLQYPLSETIRLNSKYSIILFKVFINQLNMYKKYNNKHCLELELTIDDIRKLTKTEKKYKRNSQIIDRIIDDSIEEINNKTSLKIDYNAVKIKNSYSYVQFKIEEKQRTKHFDPNNLEKILENDMNSTDITSVIEIEFACKLSDKDKMIVNLLKDLHGENKVLEGIRICIIENQTSFNVNYLSEIVSNLT